MLILFVLLSNRWLEGQVKAFHIFHLLFIVGLKAFPILTLGALRFNFLKEVASSFS